METIINTDPFALARGVEPVRDPIRDLIAEENKWRKIGNDFRERADLALFALDDAEQRKLRLGDPDDTDLPEPFGSLYADARQNEDVADEIYDRIVATKPVTLDGALALLEFASETPKAVATVIEGLRDITAKGGITAFPTADAVGDGEILSLFREWCEVLREADAEAAKIDPAGGLGADRDYNAVLDRADEIECRLLDMPANGLTGLVIKGFFLAMIARVEDGKLDDPCGAVGSIGPDDYTKTGELWRGPHTVRSFVRDAVRFLPELARLVAGVVDAPAGLPPSTEGDAP